MSESQFLDDFTCNLLLTRPTQLNRQRLLQSRWYIYFAYSIDYSNSHSS